MKKNICIYNALAYTGVLFWIPLLMNGKNEKSRTCANQGLWSLLLVSGSIVTHKIVNFLCSGIRNIFPQIIFGSVITFLDMLIIILFLLLLSCCIRNAKAAWKNETIEPIMFFEDKPIIRNCRYL